MSSPLTWIVALGDDEFAKLLGPSFSVMTSRQQELYAIAGGLNESELDELWAGKITVRSTSKKRDEVETYSSPV